MMFLLVYVDDMVLIGNNEELIQQLLTSLNKVFRMKDMGHLHYFMCIQAHLHKDGLFLNQEKYTMDLLTVAGMAVRRYWAGP